MVEMFGCRFPLLVLVVLVVGITRGSLDDCTPLNATSTTQNLNSEDYASQSGERCWVISSSQSLERVRITLDSWNLPTNSEDCTGDAEDFLEVRDGATETSPLQARYCENAGDFAVFSSSGQNLYIRLRTDSNTGNFQTEYRILSNSEIGECVYYAIIKDSPVVIQSPSYPMSYPGSYYICYSFYSVDDKNLKLEVVDLDLRETDTCLPEYLEIYDGSYHASLPSAEDSQGRMCRPDRIGEVIKTGRSASLVLQTDAASQNRGFQIEVTADYGFNSGMVVGILSGVLVPAFVIGICACRAYKAKRAQKEAAPCTGQQMK